MLNLVKQKFDFVCRCKYSKEKKYQEYIQKYLKKVIAQLSNGIKEYSFDNVKHLKDINLATPGVYLIYAKNHEDQLTFTYVGESTNVISRWKQHTRKFENGSETMYKKIRKKMLLDKVKFDDIRFFILENQSDENRRLFRETYYIYLLKARLISVNNKNCSRRLRCPNGHGMIKTKLSAKEKESTIKPVVIGTCRQKDCKITFEIN